MSSRPSFDSGWLIGSRMTSPSENPTGECPREGRLLGIDFGTRRLGFALSTPEQNLSTPLETWTRPGLPHDLRRLRELIAEYDVRGLVVGLPLHMGGEEGSSAQLAREFGSWASSETGLPVAFWDERCSSAAADEWMFAAELSRDRRKAHRDMLAAHVILQSYLDSRRPLARHEPGDDDEAQVAE